MTTTLLVTLVGCFIAQKLLEGWKGETWVLNNLALSADGLRKGFVYQLITFQFLHGGVFHLLGNCIGLYFFGRSMEAMLGSRGMLKLYLASGTVGGLLQMGLCFAFPHIFNLPVVGASAGVFGLIAAFATQAPDDPITILLFFFLPVTFPAKVLLMVEGGISILGVLGPFLRLSIFDPVVAHAAHLGGMLTGIAWIRVMMSPTPPFQFLRSLSRRPAPKRESAPAPAKRSPRAARKKPDELPAGEFISREVDPILEKISAQGIHSLTERERQILEAARNKMAKR
jgi:membrane associated rhomboid family serine protease